jgi:hypothetical protein
MARTNPTLAVLGNPPVAAISPSHLRRLVKHRHKQDGKRYIHHFGRARNHPAA